MSDEVTIPNPGFRGSKAGRYGMGARVVSPGPNAEMRKMLIVAGGLATLLAGFLGYSAIRGRHSDTVPIITADPRPLRVKPENPGGLKVDAAENDVFSGGTDTANARLAAPAEAPDTKTLRSGGAPAAGPKTLAPVAVEPPSPPPAAVKQEAIAAPAKSGGAPAAAGTGKALVQLAALTTEGDAKTEWQNLTRKYADLLKGHSPVFTRTDRDGKTFWRVRTGGFADMTQAKAFCDQIRAKGGGCSASES